MDKSISIIDKDYKQWVKALVLRYRQSQIKAAVKVNQEVLRFYWELGKDIVERDAENHYGSKFYPSLSRDLKEALQTDGFSERNLRYMKSFYLLYNEQIVNLPQVVADSEKTILPRTKEVQKETVYNWWKFSTGLCLRFQNGIIEKHNERPNMLT
jgi:hypothetical protein